MDDLTPHIDALQHNFRAGADGKYAKVTSVQYHIGTLGPFFHDFPEGQDSIATINAFIQNRAAEFRALQR